jgi:transcriptional regulator with XRE-family HTH domain
MHNVRYDTPMRRARIAAGYTLPDVAGHFHRCTRSVERWETGQTTPSRDVLVSLARLYGVTPAELVN